MHTGLAVITGTGDRQHAYAALTRGTDANLGYVFTLSPKLADPMPGPRPAPELARYDHIHTERAGGPAAPTPPDPPSPALGGRGVVAGPGSGHQADGGLARGTVILGLTALAGG